MLSKVFKLIFVVNTIFATNFFCYSQSNDFAQSSEEIESLLNSNVSTVSKYDQNIFSTPAPILIISSDEIKDMGYTDIYDVISSLNGFFVRDDHSYTYVGIRGIDHLASYNSKAIVLYDGHVLNDNIYTTPFLHNEFPISINSIERIEVIQGPGSVMYGTGAMFAVINIIPKKGKSIDGINIQTKIGSWGTKDIALNYGQEINSVDINLSFRYGENNGNKHRYDKFVDTTLNYKRNSHSDPEDYINFTGKVAYDNLIFLASYSKRNQVYTSGSWNAIFDSENPITDSRFFTEISYQYDHNIENTTQARLYFDKYKYTGEYHYENIQKDKNDGTWAGFEIRHVSDFGVDNRLSFGIDYIYEFDANYKLWDSEEVYYDKNYPSYRFSTYIQDDYQLFENLAISAGLRYDYFKLTDLNNLSPRFSLIYSPWNSFSFKYMFNHSFRAPNIYELYYEETGIHAANPKLKPEKMYSNEFLIIHDINKNTRLELTYYHHMLHDLISMDNNMKTTKFYNMVKVINQGVQASIQYKSDEGYFSELAYSYQNPIDESTKKRLENSPEHLLKLKASALFFDFWRISIENYYETSRLTLEDNATRKRYKTSDYNLTHLYSSININKLIDKFDNDLKLPSLSLGINVRNLWDRLYYLPVGNEFKQLAVLQATRAIYFTLEFGL